MKLRQFCRNSVFYRSLFLLSKKDRLKLLIATLSQIFLGFLDLIAVAAIGVLGALAVNGVSAKAPGNTVSGVLVFLNLDGLTLVEQGVLLGGGAAFLLVLKTLASMFTTRKILIFLGHRGADISAKLVAKLLSKDLLYIQSKSIQEFVFMTTTGVETITLRVLGVFISIAADLSLLMIIMCGLIVLDPIMALLTFIIFSLVGLLIYKFLHKRAHSLGVKNTTLDIGSRSKIAEVLTSYKESVVRGRRDFYSEEIGSMRRSQAAIGAEIAFMPNIGKYIIEAAVILGALVVAAVQFGLTDASRAVATLSVFLISGTRIAPAILRIQQGAIQIRGNIGIAKPTLEIIGQLSKDVPNFHGAVGIDLKHVGFMPDVSINNLSFSYPGVLNKSIDISNLNFASGEITAVVGPSGAGKTTLVDLILGLLTPDEGTITISGKNPKEAITNWPGAIAYVPQDISISNGSILDNVALGYPKESIDRSQVLKVIELAQLELLIANLPDGIDSQVGERGTQLSGGQRQRIGIARALFTNPKLIVLDEATSSLDSQTEDAISKAIDKLSGKATVIIIAHRLSTVKNAHKVIYIDSGRVLSAGKFDEVRKEIPDFDFQAKLLDN
jgi:ABC-type multidrug transport system fused ATPase/permease subunit